MYVILVPRLAEEGICPLPVQRFSAFKQVSFRIQGLWLFMSLGCNDVAAISSRAIFVFCILGIVRGAICQNMPELRDCGKPLRQPTCKRSPSFWKRWQQLGSPTMRLTRRRKHQLGFYLTVGWRLLLDLCSLTTTYFRIPSGNLT